MVLAFLGGSVFFEIHDFDHQLYQFKHVSLALDLDLAARANEKVLYVIINPVNVCMLFLQKGIAEDVVLVDIELDQKLEILDFRIQISWAFVSVVILAEMIFNIILQLCINSFNIILLQFGHDGIDFGICDKINA